MMLGRHDIAESLTSAVEKSYPAMRAQLEGYAAEHSPQEKSYAGLFTVLRSPGLRPYINAGSAREATITKIDSYRDNWWCKDLDLGPQSDKYDGDNHWWDRESDLEIMRARSAPPDLAFLSPERVEAARSEWQKLKQLGAGPSYLARQTLQWAKDRPDDPRVPEALHFAVRSTRYSCDDEQTSALSHKAFELLHSRYASSKWAKQTPYWF